MSESPEERLNHDVARTLRFDTRVTAAQQRSAKERLLLAAAAQPMLPPLPIAAVKEKVPLRQHIYTLKRQTARLLELLLTDSSMYERARRPLHPNQYYTIYGRYAFGVIYMSA